MMKLNIYSFTKKKINKIKIRYNLNKKFFFHNFIYFYFNSDLISKKIKSKSYLQMIMFSKIPIL